MNNRKITINKVCKLNRETIRSNNQPEYINYLDTGNITRNKIEEIKRLINEIDKYPSRAQRKVQKNTIIYSTVRPEQEHFGIIEDPIDNLIVSTGFTTLDLIDDTIDAKYFYYSLTNKSITDYLNVIASNNVTSYPSLNPNDIGDLVLKIPSSKTEQQKIAKVLSDLDAKIELNNTINDNLEHMAKTLYDYWFVQFDFPNADGKPYKTSEGKMVWNEDLKREIPVGWEMKNLGDLINIFDSKRIPLSRSQREQRIGSIPYYGATSIMGYVDEHIFDDDYILLAEDGSVMDENGFPIVQFIWGKTWVNNHAHVIQAKNITNNEFVFQLVKTISVVQIITGSIQLKINQENLRNVKVILPDKNILKKFSRIAIPIRKKLINSIEENQELASLRDWLLPMLMNGQVSVGEFEEELRMVAERGVEYKRS